MLSNYRIGLVLSQAGMNPVQSADVKARLKFIAQLGGAEGGGIQLIAPSLHHPGPAGARDVEKLVEALSRIEYVKVLIVEDVCAVPDCINLFKDADEVWCFPAARQSKLTKARPWVIYDYAIGLGESRKYKIIPPWTETPAASARATLKRNHRKADL